MKTKISKWLFMQLAFVVIGHASAAQPGFDRAAFYAVLKTGDVNEIDKEISAVDGVVFEGKEAYKGTLLMKKAGLVKRPKEKIDLFKEGRIKLETELHNDGHNTEYHFLRLIIQEHAPKITKYRAQLKEDCSYIITNFKKLPPVVQQVVVDYSKTSTILQSADFN